MSKKSKKGKTIPLTDFLASEPKLVPVRESTWAAIVDEAEEQKKTMVVDISILPTAPRAAADIDYSTVPTNPPFVAHVANLPFDIEDENLRRIFGDLNPIAARIIRENNRSRGIGLVEFETRENFIEALKRTDKEVFGRRIRVNVSDKNDFHQNDGNRTHFSQRSYRMGGGRSGEERPEMADRWQRSERRTDDSFEDRPRNDYNRDRPNRNESGRPHYSNQPRDNQRGGDYGYGYPRTRDDRPGPRHRYNNDDNNRQNYRSDRPRYDSRYSDTQDRTTTPTSQDETREAPKERRRLQLQPRTKPLEEFQALSNSSLSVNSAVVNSSQSNIDESHDNSSNHPDEYQHQQSHETSDAGSSIESSTIKSSAPSRGAGASIFGGAKPVNTAAKELEIERKLQELQLANSETTEDQTERPQQQQQQQSSSRSNYHRQNDRNNYRQNDRDNYRNKRPSHNNDYHNRDRRDDGRSGQGSDYHHKREYSGGRRYENDSRRSNDGDYQRRDRDRYNNNNNNTSRRDYDSGRGGRYNNSNHHDRGGENYRYRDRDSNEFNSHRRTSEENFNSESQPQNQPRIIIRRTVQTEDDSNKLQLSNKFNMLDDNDDENLSDVDAQSPTIDE